MKKILFLAISLLANNANSATLLSDTTNINRSGQSDSKTYDATGFEDFNNVALDVHAVGDYGRFEGNEFINFNIDGINFGSFRYNTPGISATQVGSSAFDWDLVFSILIPDAQWSNFILNDELNITWTNGRGTNSAPQHFVNYQINGTPVGGSQLSAVPEPATIALMGLGLVGASLSRKKKATIYS